MTKGALFLVPTPLVAMDDLQALPESTLVAVRQLRHFMAEVPKTARQFLQAIDMPVAIQDITVWGMEKHGKTDLEPMFQALSAGHSVGILSEAGCPGVADPGSNVVAEAHRRSITVKPLVGPSSILLALMASGMNGQAFAFHGYLPRERDPLVRVLGDLERESAHQRQTQIFIEAPYRNDKLLTTLLQQLQPRTQLCVARDLTSAQQWVRSMSVAEWKQAAKPELFKRPAIFLFSAEPRKKRR